MTVTAPAISEKNLANINRAIQQLGQGRSNATGTFTLTANATTTVVTNSLCLPNSLIFLSPQTPDAANDGATTSTVAGTGSFTVNHANNARTDRTFGYVILT